MDKYVQASWGTFSAKNNQSEPTRRTANYHPNIWGDHFLKYASDCTRSDSGTQQQIEQLRDQVRKMIVNGGGGSGSDELDNLDQQLKLIDEIQRLGVSYHFESQIDSVINNQPVNLNGECYNNINDDDLYIVSLRFRLLRQHGHHVSCGKPRRLTFLRNDQMPN